jgi:hypothetical protein
LTKDTIFRESVGSTHFPGEDDDILISTLKRVVLTIPEDYAMFASHYGFPTFAHELTSNSYLQICSSVIFLFLHAIIFDFC